MNKSPEMNFRLIIGIGALLGLVFAGGFHWLRPLEIEDRPLASNPEERRRTGVEPLPAPAPSCDDETGPLHIEIEDLRERLVATQKDLAVYQADLRKVRKRLAVREIDVSNLQDWLAQRDRDVDLRSSIIDVNRYEAAPCTPCTPWAP